MKIVKKFGNVHTKAELKNKITKEVIGEEDEDKKLEPVEQKKGEVIAMVRWVDRFNTSHSFQSFGIEVGIDFPFSVKPGDTGAITKAFKQCEELCDSVMAEKILEAPEIIKKLVSLKKLMKE